MTSKRYRNPHPQNNGRGCGTGSRSGSGGGGFVGFGSVVNAHKPNNEENGEGYVNPKHEGENRLYI